MKSYVALGRAIQRKTRDFANKLGLSPSMVGKWQEPPSPLGSGARNPLDVVEEIVRESFHNHEHPDDALAPIHYLAQRFDLICIPVDSFPSDHRQLIEHILETNKSTASFLVESNESPAKLKNKKQALRTKGYKALQMILALLKKVEEIEDKGNVIAKARGAYRG